jgi:prepilin-type processing-associated H-X9-DG protein
LALAEYIREPTASISNPSGVGSRGSPYTNRAGRQFIYARYTPNTSNPDDLLDGARFCKMDGQGPSGTSSYNLPNLNAPCFGDSSNNAENSYASARSQHLNGVNTVFCDGHVAFITNDVSLSTWQALAWMSDGQVPGPY